MPKDSASYSPGQAIEDLTTALQSLVDNLTDVGLHMDETMNEPYGDIVEARTVLERVQSSHFPTVGLDDGCLLDSSKAEIEIRFEDEEGHEIIWLDTPDTGKATVTTYYPRSHPGSYVYVSSIDSTLTEILRLIFEGRVVRTWKFQNIPTKWSVMYLISQLLSENDHFLDDHTAYGMLDDLRDRQQVAEFYVFEGTSTHMGDVSFLESHNSQEGVMELVSDCGDNADNLVIVQVSVPASDSDELPSVSLFAPPVDE